MKRLPENVADAYQHWSDVTEDELMGLLNKAGLLSSEIRKTT
jgi:hypothetical protein